MKAGVFRAARAVTVEEVDEPEGSADGILVDVRACGICGSDLHIYHQGGFVEPGQIMGHELAGEVMWVGADVRGIAVGDRIAAMPILPCGACRGCRAGEEELCVRAFAPGLGFGFPGGFAERLHIPRAVAGRTVFALPADVGWDAVALAEPLAVAVHAVRQSQIAGGDVAVVLGLGPIGQLIARALIAAGVQRVVGVERSAFRRRLAQQGGIPAVADVADLADLADPLGGDAPDVVFECTGVPALAQQAVRLVRRGGTAMIVAVYEAPAPVDVSGFGVTERTVRGSTAYAVVDFAEAVRLLADGTVSAADLVTDHTPLADLPAALERQLQGADTLKVIIEP